MGKIKTVVMGDEAAEEAARKKGETKRSQKQLLKGAQTPEKSEDSESQKVRESEKSETPEVRVSELSEPPEKKSKKRITESKYRFPTGKKYTAARSLVNPKKPYSLPEAIELAKKTSYSKFDGSVEAHFNVTDKNLRGTVTLPHGNGKQVRVKIADEALIANPIIDFDILVATTAMMPKLAKIAKILGPKGLMPNPKTNTISENPAELVKILSSSVQWKTQPDFPIIHVAIGKVSFENKKLEENLAALIKSIGMDKIRSAFLKATMGPAVRLAL